VVVISNGFNKFHLAVAAEELAKRLKLSMLITGAYPTARIRKISSTWPLSKFRKFGRLSARGQKIPENQITSLWLPEGIHAFGLGLKKFSWVECFRGYMDATSLKAYGHHATKHITKAAYNGASIYHYRAGFGQKSVAAAKAAGMVTICDFSIAHGSVIGHLINNQGQFPPPGVHAPINHFWSLVLNDTKQADYVFVNSDFVRDTFLHQGWDRKRIKVIYWGIDDQFLNEIDAAPDFVPDRREPLKVLYAGTFERRKGVDTLFSALASIVGFKWQLTIAGSIPRKTRKKYKSFLSNSRVRYLGILTRSELAKCMRKTEVFLFPSYAEGSARVIFEALAAGCYVITTPNSGSIVKDGEQGCIIPPGDERALADALYFACRNRHEIRHIGRCNAELIKTHYRQKHYGDQLIFLYNQLLNL
jgi:glycosyltransferase involved in cell wall biosynthesis